MGIEIKTGSAFDKRLAELAWEHADELTKTTLANIVALAIAGNRSVLDSLAGTLAETVVEQSIVTVLASSQVEQAITKATNSIVDSLQSEIPSMLAKAEQAVVKRLVSEHMNDAWNAAELRQPTVRARAMDTIHDAIIDAAQEVAQSCKGSINAELLRTTSKVLEAMRHYPKDDERETRKPQLVEEIT